MSQVSEAKQSASAAAQLAQSIAVDIYELKGRLDQVMELAEQGIQGTSTNTYSEVVGALTEAGTAFDNAALNFGLAASAARHFAESA